MNLVVRARTDSGRTLILKQAPPFVQKYPQIAAPVERILVESRFYELTTKRPETAAFLPKTIGFDAENHLLAIEDLGSASDFLWIYENQKHLENDDIASAATFLSRLHSIDFDEKTRTTFPKNKALRELNAQHLFHFPFDEKNGFDLDQVQKGLTDAAQHFQKSVVLKSQLLKLETAYLGDGSRLLHGDFYPGSWLATEKGLRVIDPEFCFFGPPEYDFGVFIAHLRLAKTPFDGLRTAFEKYIAPDGFDARLAARFEGMEILRRVIGLAQLPLDCSIEERAGFLEDAAKKF